MILEDPGKFSTINDSMIPVLHSGLSLLDEFIPPSKALFCAASFASNLNKHFLCELLQLHLIS